MHIHEAFHAVHAEISFTKTIGALSRNMSDMMDEGDIPDILLSQIAEMMECEAKAYKGGISHMDLSNKNIKHYCMKVGFCSPIFIKLKCH